MAKKNRADVQLPYLETFFKAAELNSFTAAGKALGVSQAAISQRIHALEQLLRGALFERKGRHILLTEAGQSLYVYAQRILSLHREAFEEITGQSLPVVGDLVLAASSIPGVHLLPDILSIFHRQYPNIRVRATMLDSMAVLDQVTQGKAHLGLVGRRDENRCLEFRSFARDQMVLIVPPHHRWKRLKEVTFKEFSQEPLVIRESGSGSRWCLEQALAARGKRLSDLQIALELGSNESIKEAVLKGMGVAVLSKLAVQKELAAKQLHALNIKNLPMVRTLFVAWDTRRALPAPARLFLQVVQQACDERPHS